MTNKTAKHGMTDAVKDKNHHSHQGTNKSHQPSGKGQENQRGHNLTQEDRRRGGEHSHKNS